MVGVSHGMGTREQLPETQLSVAESGATTDKMPEQARELVRRLKNLIEVNYKEHWTMVIVTIGTEEVCSRCTSPNFTALIEAIDILQLNLPRAFVVLLGPIHVSFPHKLKGNLLKSRCECSREASNALMEQLSADWEKAFEELQEHVDSSPFRGSTFGILAIPELTITSRYPYGLFIPNKPLLNRRGHNYATKWLWNRLIAGENYNLSAAVLSQDAYFCPSIGCPYFRNTANYHGCQLLSLSEAKEKELLLGMDGKVLKKDRDRSIVTDAKIVPYETDAPQHRPLVCTVNITPLRVQQVERCGAARIKLEFGTTKPGRRKVDKQTWLWTDDVKAKIREKKSLYHVFLGDRTNDNWQKYQKAKKGAKKSVAVAKATHYGDRRRTPERLYTIAICIVGIAFFVVCMLGTVFYQKSKQGDHGRFEIVDDAQKKFEEAQKEEEKALLSRQVTRGMSMNDNVQRSTRRLTGDDA
ncbi:unnamed protein product [Heligmosomoides polygyrus]|uniref:Uncharacterized protein n=1 Tax=Heligmosomoides polygyrus TaxID=6339 RepID=A0A3P8DLL2_HELPZ|nr:unnamed protein product [Heligmosomoides polygyrus]